MIESNCWNLNFTAHKYRRLFTTQHTRLGMVMLFACLWCNIPECVWLCCINAELACYTITHLPSPPSFPPLLSPSLLYPPSPSLPLDLMSPRTLHCHPETSQSFYWFWYSFTYPLLVAMGKELNNKGVKYVTNKLCKACNLLINGDAFYCVDCEGSVHAICAGLSRDTKILLFVTNRNFSCNSCIKQKKNTLKL